MEQMSLFPDAATGFFSFKAEALSPDEAFKQAGLDFDVSLSKLKTEGNVTVPDFRAVVRGDNDKILGIVGSRYSIIQNREAFGLFKEILKETRAELTELGHRAGGAHVWFLAKLPQAIKIADGDTLERYFFLCNYHDGSGALKLIAVPKRIICENMLTPPLRKLADKASVFHLPSKDKYIEELKRITANMAKYFNEFDRFAMKMAEKPLDKKEADAYLSRIFLRDQERLSARQQKAAEDRMKKVAALYEKNPANTLKSVKGTLWALYNAVTQYVDHERTPQTGGQKAGFTWFGEGARIKSLALEEALKQLN